MATYRSLSGARFARIGRLARRLVIDERVSGLPDVVSEQLRSGRWLRSAHGIYAIWHTLPTVAATAGMDR
jgi:hypothetical protein